MDAVIPGLRFAHPQLRNRAPENDEVLCLGPFRKGRNT
jgi:hypothetical protein